MGNATNMAHLCCVVNRVLGKRPFAVTGLYDNVLFRRECHPHTLNAIGQHDLPSGILYGDSGNVLTGGRGRHARDCDTGSGQPTLVGAKRIASGWGLKRAANGVILVIRVGGSWVVGVTDDNLLINRVSDAMSLPSALTLAVDLSSNPERVELFKPYNRRKMTGGKTPLVISDNGGFEAFDLDDSDLTVTPEPVTPEPENGPLWTGTDGPRS